jgi:hypothetical protein
MEVSACQDRDRNLGLKVKNLESMNGVKNKEYVNRVENEFQHVSLGLSSHQSTRVENTGEQVPEVFAKITRGGQGFQEKLPGGTEGWHRSLAKIIELANFLLRDSLDLVIKRTKNNFLIKKFFGCYLGIFHEVVKNEAKK